MQHLERWLDDAAFAPYRPQLLARLERGDWAELLDAFGRELPFGTGGRRGRVGIGPNRLNPHTLAEAVGGHARSLPRGSLVAVAWDVRRFQDLGGAGVPGVPDPLLGLTSRDLAAEAARVYGAYGIRTAVAETCHATPELSWAVRRLGASGGLNVSASHNPPDDNGAKVYDGEGCQVVPPDDAELARLARGGVRRGAPLREPLPASVRSSLVAHLVERSLVPSRSASIVYTALHGVGASSVLPVLLTAGFAVDAHPEQARPDGAFPSVPGRDPNPESPRALDAAVALATERGADLVLGTDPDADRVGAVVRHGGRWVVLTGQDLCAILTHHVLAHTPVTRPVVVKTAVTSGLVTRVAEAAGASVVGELPVGFKFIGRVLRELELHGVSEGLAARVDDFVLGVEESHGALTTPHLRDKDAAGAALALAEAASLARDRGHTLVDVLHGLWEAHGPHRHRLASVRAPGAAGRVALAGAMARLRAAPPTELAGEPVLRVVDLLAGAPDGEAPARDQLTLELAHGRVTLRPSGTEPKAKVYSEAWGAPGDRPEDVDRHAAALSRAGLATLAL